MSGDQARRLEELDQENERLRRAVSYLRLHKQILAEAAREINSPWGAYGSMLLSALFLPERLPRGSLFFCEVSLRLPHDGVRGAGGSI